MFITVQTYKDCFMVAVHQDGTNDCGGFAEDSCEIRWTTYCTECNEILYVHYGEPFASCSCGTQEWYK